jgi:hypothetical protein
VTLAAEDGGVLVHHAALDPDELALHPLAELRHAQRVPRDLRQRAEQPGDRHLDRGRRGQARAQRHVAVEHELRTAHMKAGGAHRPGHARDVGQPLPSAGRLQLVEPDLAGFAEDHRVHAQPPIGPRNTGDPRAAVDRHRQHPTVVVVGVLADQVDAPRRHRDAGLGRRAEGRREVGA